MVLSLLFACGCLYVLFSEQNDLFGELLYKMGINNAFDEICIIGLSASLFFYWWGAGNLVLLMVLSIAVNYLILIVGTLSLYSSEYLSFVFINMFTIPVLFLFIFQWKLYRFRKDNHE